jgi:hypothetical protein
LPFLQRCHPGNLAVAASFAGPIIGRVPLSRCRLGNIAVAARFFSLALSRAASLTRKVVGGIL